MLRASYVTLVLLAVAGSVPATAGTLKCAADAAKVGNACVDRYEASVWQIAPAASAFGVSASPQTYP